MTPSTKPVTRLTSAFVRDPDYRPVVATITGSLIELRVKGRRRIEVLDITTLYYMAVKARVIAEKKAKKAAKAAKKGL
jgi:hypothetical protein